MSPRRRAPSGRLTWQGEFAADGAMMTDRPGRLEANVAARDWRGLDLSRHERLLQAGPWMVNVLDVGQGTTRVLVHGMGGRWQHWIGLVPCLPDLAASWR
jgi:hypothetical protein